MSSEFVKVTSAGSRGDWVFWRNMKKMKTLYKEDYNQSDYEVFEFSKWLEVNFGIKILFDTNGNVLRDYYIVDEAKYTFYLLKYT
jgi:hypothetical protein